MDDATVIRPAAEPLLTRLVASPTLRQAFRFGIVGGTSYFLNLGFFAVIVWAGGHYLAAAAAAFGLGFAFNFLANRYWTFTAGTGQANQQFIRFSILAGVILALDLALLRVAVGELGLPSVVAQGVVILLLAPLSFAGNRFWSFAKPS